jgi:hypothetical protein
MGGAVILPRIAAPARGEVARESAPVGASGCSLGANPPPPPRFAWSPSPAPFHCADADKQHRPRDTFLCPSLADHEANRFAPSTKREAKRRKAHANHVPRSISKRCRLPMRRARLRAMQTSARSLRTHLLAGRARLPALRPRLSQGFPSLLSSRPCFLGLGTRRALPASSCPSPVTAPHASAVVPKGMMPKAAPARVASPRGSTALAPHCRSHPECVPR